MSKSVRRPARMMLRADQIEIDGYHILEELSLGRTVGVYRAVQESVQREVALKVLHPDLAEHPNFVDRFTAEARAASAVSHPNVVACYDAAHSGRLLYQVLELVPGGDLDHYVQQRGGLLGVKEAIGIVLDCARGLEAIYAAGLVHGDIRPSNIVIDDNGTAKLADFGLARSLLAENEHLLASEDPISSFMAPELVHDAGLHSIQTDLYSLGAMLYFLCTGQVFNESDAHVGDDVEVAISQLPGGVRGVILHSMQREIDWRYQSPAEMREDLERIQYDFSPVHARRLGTTDQSSGSWVKRTPVPSGEVRLRSETGNLRRGETDLGSYQRLRSPTALGDDISDSRIAVAESAKSGFGGMLLIALLIAVVAVSGLLGVVFMQQPPAYSESTASRGPAPVQDQPAPPVVAVPTVRDVAPDPILTPPGPQPQRPEWATDFGYDARGWFSELVIAEQALPFRFCPPGSFEMGSTTDDPGHRPDEIRHRVILSAGFWLAAHETHQALYEVVMGTNPSSYAGRRLPVERVNWNDAVGFAARLNKVIGNGAAFRLPTEAEWEYAATAGGSASTVDPEKCWSSENADRRTQEVARLDANGWGFHDLHGNVMEWVADSYAPYPIGTVRDPLNEDGIYRVLRGGAWSLPAVECRSAARDKQLPVTRLFVIGCRLASDAAIQVP